jgi:ankyrin repeat protein
MRLLRTDRLEIEEFGFGQIPEYAILSHRWGEYELTLQDIQNCIWAKEGFSNESAKIEAFRKVQQCCLKAQSDSFRYVWVDSCCIDKTSSSELSEAINSMYLWYYKASKCYAYLADVQSISTFKKSEWFTRGWTLQELLAPSEVYFVNKDWKVLGTKASLRQEISDQSRIPVNILAGSDLETTSVAQRMSWASNRRTTRIEDRAYCLMGIFGINMPLLYGEGERAFIRLQEEIMKISDDHSLFAWKSSDIRGGLLATSPDAFIGSSNIVQYNPYGNPSGPLAVSNRGVHLELRFIGRGPRGLGMAILHCRERDKEDRPLVLLVRDTTLTMEIFERVWSETFECINLRKFRVSQYPIRKICIRMGRMSITSKSENSLIQSGVMEEIYHEATLNTLMKNDTKELFHAARAGDQDLVWLLLTRNDIKADSKDEKRQTALCHAVINRHEALTKTLLSRRDVNIENKDYRRQTPLLLAVCYGHEDIAKLLLERGADPVVGDEYGRTPLSQAVYNGRKGIVKLLVENGANTETRDNNGRTPLLVAIANGREDIVKLLAENGADIEARDDDGRTPLLVAIANRRKDIVKLLVENGANIEARDEHGETPLSRAIANGREDIVQLLVESIADIKGRDNRGGTPLSWAIANGHEDIVKLLVENGADIEERDEYGETPLSQAIVNEREDIVKLLIEKGADTPEWVLDWGRKV